MEIKESKYEEFLRTESCGLRRCEKCGKCKVCFNKCEIVKEKTKDEKEEIMPWRK